MTFELSRTDIGFLCMILEQSFPLFLEDPFAGFSTEKMEEEWNDFCESFFSKGFLIRMENGSSYIVDDLMDQLAGIFTAEQVITVVEKDEVTAIIYIGEGTERNVIVKVYPDYYSLSLVNSKGYHNELLSLVACPDKEMNPVNEFQVEVSLSVFERLLETYSDQGREVLFTYCENLNIPPVPIHTILKAVHSKNTIVFLTENIRHRETAIAIVATESGNIKVATTVYSKEGNKVTLKEARLETLPLLLIK